MLPSLDGGGVERGTVELSEELVRRGHRSMVISSGGRLTPTILEHGGEHICWSIGKKSPMTLRWFWPLRQLLKRESVDILHVRSRVPAWVAWMAWKGLPVAQRPKFVTTAHGLYSVNRYSEIMTSGERVIAISETVRDYLKTNYERIDAEKIRVVPRGVDPNEFPRGFQPSAQWLENWYEEFPQLLGRPVISLVGRLTRLKGHRDLIEIVDQLRHSIPEIQALIVGAPDPRRQGYADELKQLVAERQLGDHVIFAGHRKDVREIYAVSNAVMCLTADPPEAFGRTTVEALSIGTPVIGYDHGGTGEILRTLYPGGVIPVGEIAAAVNTVQRVLNQPGDVPSEHPYLKQTMLDQTISIYDELAA